MNRHPAITAACLILVAFLTSRPVARASQAPAPAPAPDVVKAAVTRAAREDKVVLIEFGASWCTWCRSFDAFVKAPETGPIIAANYVVTNLTVHERDDKTPLENPGGAALMDAWGGAKSGLPFYVFVDRTGKKLADSNVMPNGDNIGFPAVPGEIAAFLGLIDRTAPRLPASARTTLEAYLVRVMPPPKDRP
jgi:thiol-disulfide isomerase/thioredoxin